MGRKNQVWSAAVAVAALFAAQPQEASAQVALNFESNMSVACVGGSAGEYSAYDQCQVLRFVLDVPSSQVVGGVTWNNARTYQVNQLSLNPTWSFAEALKIVAGAVTYFDAAQDPAANLWEPWVDDSDYLYIDEYDVTDSYAPTAQSLVLDVLMGGFDTTIDSADFTYGAAGFADEVGGTRLGNWTAGGGKVSNSTVTPEPVSMALLGTGLAGLGAVRRRRRRTLGA